MTVSSGVPPDPFVPSLRRAWPLLAGRGLFRVCQAASAASLSFVWSATAYAQYAAALVSAGWLTALAAAGIEKTLIALAPRPGGGAAVSRLLAATLVSTAVLLVGVLIALPVHPGVALWGMAALYGGALGAVIVAVAVLRLAGCLWADPVALSTLGLAHLIVPPLAMMGWPPRAAFGVLSVAALATAVTAGIIAWRRRERPSREGAVTGLVRQILLTGCSEVCNMIAVGIVFIIIAASPFVAEMGVLYLAGLLGQLAIGAMAYIARLRGAWVSRQAYRNEFSASRNAVRSLRSSSYWSMIHLVAIAGLVVTAAWIDVSRRPLVVIVAMLAVLPTLLTLRACSIAEFTGQAGRRCAATGSVAGLLITALLGWVLVPFAGALGGVISLVAGATVQGTVAASLLDGRGVDSRS